MIYTTSRLNDSASQQPNKLRARIVLALKQLNVELKHS